MIECLPIATSALAWAISFAIPAGLLPRRIQAPGRRQKPEDGDCFEQLIR